MEKETLVLPSFDEGTEDMLTPKGETRLKHIVGSPSRIGALIIIALIWVPWIAFHPSAKTRFDEMPLLADSNARMGIVRITTAGPSQTIQGNGMKVVGAPTTIVGWKEYVNRTHSRTFLPSGELAFVATTNSNEEVDTIAWSLNPDENIKEVLFAYYFYDGPSPPEDWYEMVIRKCR